MIIVAIEFGVFCFWADWAVAFKFFFYVDQILLTVPLNLMENNNKTEKSIM